MSTQILVKCRAKDLTSSYDSNGDMVNDKLWIILSPILMVTLSPCHHKKWLKIRKIINHLSFNERRFETLLNGDNRL